MNSRICILVSAALLCLSPWPHTALAADEDARISDLEHKLDQSLQLIQQLSARVKQLEAGAAAGRDTPASQATQASQAPRAAQAPKETAEAHQQMGQMGSMETANAGVPFHGFADIGGGTRQGEPKGFTTGSFDMYLAPQFSDRVRALFEALIEFDESGEPGIDLERAQIGYAFRDEFTLWGGRFHTPFGYYNTAFHHGQLMQTSIKKPRFMDFEDHGGVMPSHTVGVWATGRFTLGESKWAYDAFVGNSPSIVGSTLDMNNVGSRNHNASTGLNVGYVGADGSLKVGGHYYRARVADDSVPANVTDMSFVGPYAVYDDGVWVVISEYYRFNNDDVVSNTGAPTGNHRSFAWFGQLGRRFGAWMPYARYEKASLDQSDNYFALLGNGHSYSRELGGLRYDVNPRAAFTVELNHTKQDDLTLPDYNEFRFQYAIGF